MPEVSTVTFQDAVTTASAEVMASVLGVLPTILGAVLVFAVGLIIAGWLKTLVMKLLEALSLSKLLGSTGVKRFLDKADVKSSIENVVGEVVRWLVILVFFIATVNLLGLVTVSGFLNSILGYIPSVLSAALVLAAGVLVAGWVESLVKGAVGSVNLGTGRLLGKISSYTIVVFTVLAAISELGIAAQFINTLFIGFIAMLSLGLGLAFGLGAKDLVGEILSDWHKQLKRDLK
jgi:hypothetical protein